MLSALCLLLLPTPALADPMELRSRSVDPGSIVVDGDPGEWRGVRARRLGDCGERSGEWEGPDDASMRFALAHDAQKLYLAARVRDDQLRPPRDRVVLYLGFPGGHVHEIEAIPGDGARVAAKVLVDGHAARGGEAVEMVREPGWSLEASIPWETMPEARRDRTDLRAAVVLEDGDGGGGTTRLSTVSGDPRRHGSLAALWLSDQESTLQTFLAEHDLRGSWPSFEASGNVAGDAMRERVLVVDTYLVVFGPGYRGGRGYFYTALPVGSSRDVRRARLADVTGDGRDDILLDYVEPGGGGVRGVFAVHSFKGEDLERVFAVETKKEIGPRSIEAEIEVRGHGDGTRIDVRPGRAHGLDARTFREAPAGDMEPILLPWGPVERRTYRFDGTRFVRESEDTREVEAAPAQPRSERPTEAAPAPEPPSQTDVFARFLQSSGLVGTRPAFDRHGNVSGDRRDERAAVVGKRLVVLGPGFAGGTSFFFMDLPVAAPGDVLALDLRDGTGDGRADVVIRFRQIGDGWGREILEVLAFEGENARPSLLAEVALFQGDNRLETEVRFVRSGHGQTVEIRPGRARGFTAQTFPRRAEDPRVRAIPRPW